MRWRRKETGHYYTAEGYEVIKDVTGYVTIEQREGDGLLSGCDDDGWASVYPDDEQDWWDTKREAVAACERHLKIKLQRKEREQRLLDQEQESLVAGHLLMAQHPEVWQ